MDFIHINELSVKDTSRQFTKKNDINLKEIHILVLRFGKCKQMSSLRIFSLQTSLEVQQVSRPAYGKAVIK